MRSAEAKRIGDALKRLLPPGSSYAFAIATPYGQAYRFEGEPAELSDVIDRMREKLDEKARRT